MVQNKLKCVMRYLPANFNSHFRLQNIVKIACVFVCLIQRYRALVLPLKKLQSINNLQITTADGPVLYSVPCTLFNASAAFFDTLSCENEYLG